ncbi:MAG: transposase [Sedimentisphaerales bacterium]|nr:transposase [Sedimentisphaerales bacterium]
MPRAKRQSPGGIVYHVLNRANARQIIFRGSSDYEAFEKILAEGLVKVPMRLTGYCLMSNHWHLLLWPYHDGELSTFMHWVTMTHTQRWHAVHHSIGTGHLYQGRFKSFPIQDEPYYLTALRYIESNPFRAGLVTSSSHWMWSSLAIRRGLAKSGVVISPGPVELPDKWDELVDILPWENDLEKIERCLRRGTPLGRDDWAKQVAERLFLTSTLHPRGRPKKGS